MALESSEVRSFGFGHVYTAEPGSVEPANINAPVLASNGWVEHGHISDAGPRFSFGKGRTPVRSWQSYPEAVRNLKAEAVTTVSYDLLQWNRHTIPLALGGGSWTSDGAGLFTFTPADASENNERALIVEAVDDGYNYRFIFRKTENQANVDFAWTGTALAPLPIVATALAADGNLTPYIIQTDDPNAGIDEASS